MWVANRCSVKFHRRKIDLMHAYVGSTWCCAGSLLFFVADRKIWNSLPILLSGIMQLYIQLLSLVFGHSFSHFCNKLLFSSLHLLYDVIMHRRPYSLATLVWRRSKNYSLVDLFIYTFIHSFIHSFIHPFIYSVIHCFTHCFIDSFESLTHSFFQQVH